MIIVHGNLEEEYSCSEESVNDDEEYEDTLKMIPPPANHHHHSHNHLRKHFPPPPLKNFRSHPSPSPVPSWKAADEMIGVAVPRKARSGREVDTII